MHSYLLGVGAEQIAQGDQVLCLNCLDDSGCQ
jgi:hypothetical protein